MLALATTASLALSLGGPKVKVVFTDCDGTMLTPDHTLSPAASQMLHTLADAGVRVVPATGRARAGAWTEAVLTHPILNNGVPGVYINGCSGFTEAGDELAATHLPPAVVTRVLDWAAGAEAAGTGLVAYVGDEALHTQPAFIERLAALGDSPPRAVAEIGTDGVYKMIVLCEDDAIAQRLRPKLEVLLDAGGAELTQALPGYIEVVPTGASKATAAAALLDRWGLTWSDALAIGDGQNDVPMLREAGTSVAMANAKQSVRDAAQFGCASNADDGWVEAMERYVLS